MKPNKCPFCTSTETHEVFENKLWRCKTCSQLYKVNAISDAIISPQKNFIPEVDTNYDLM